MGAGGIFQAEDNHTDSSEGGVSFLIKHARCHSFGWMMFDGFVKSPDFNFFVIPAKAGIQ